MYTPGALFMLFLNPPPSTPINNNKTDPRRHRGGREKAHLLGGSANWFTTTDVFVCSFAPPSQSTSDSA